MRTFFFSGGVSNLTTVAPEGPDRGKRPRPEIRPRAAAESHNGLGENEQAGIRHGAGHHRCLSDQGRMGGGGDGSGLGRT